MSFDFFNNIRDWFGTEARDAKVMARVAAERRQRLVKMAVDPVRRRYVERIERGEHWHDADITFNESPNVTNVCEHPRPIEQLMRASRIDLRIATEHRITANCLVNFEKLGHQLNLAESVTYIKPHIPDRSMLDPHSAIIVCSGCNASIFAVHSDSATQNTLSFPR